MSVPGVLPFCTTGDFTPINSMLAVTPSDAADLPGGVTRGFWVNGAGTVNMDTANGETVALTISATQAGTIVWIRAKRIRATSTTATGIFALY